MQSHTEVLNFLANNPEDICVSHKVPVISIAPQSLASLAASISSSSKAVPVSLQQIYRRVEAFCTKVLGFQRVYDITFARHLALLEHVREFKERQKGNGQLPMLASACPGWVCYAEKTHAEMLPFISRSRSPQQVMGTLVKEWLGPKWDRKYVCSFMLDTGACTHSCWSRPSQIYHVTVMPCYDKKLEASRQDFYNDVYGTRDVDCVITTGELELMMREKGWDLSSPVEGENDDRVSPGSLADDLRENIAAKSDHGDDLPELIIHPGTSSGSYLHSLINTIVHESPAAFELNVRAVRAPDYEEYILTEKATSTVVFRGAKCYGFRNLQNLVRKVGREAGVQVGRGAAGRLAGVRGRAIRKKADGSAVETKYDYVEVMACPGGCVNGGGQLRTSVSSQSGVDEEGYKRDWDASGVKLDDDDTAGKIQPAKWGDREWTKKVEVAYWSDLPTPPPSPKLDGKSDGELASTSVEGKTAQAERLAARVLAEMCHPKGSAPRSWTDGMDEDAEALRRKYFRTQYRAVEGEVVGLAVKW